MDYMRTGVSLTGLRAGFRVTEACKLRDRYSQLRAISNQRLGRESSTDSVNASQMNLTREEGPHVIFKQVFAAFDQSAKGKTCDAMKGLLEEARR